MVTTNPLPPSKNEPELNLLLAKDVIDEPLWKSLVENLNDFFFPKKQPPLVLTSKPVPVKDIWGFYDHKRGGALGSTAVHIVAVAVLLGVSMLARRVVQQVTKHEEVTLIAPSDLPTLQPSKTLSGGGGGGGDRDKFQAPKGKLPKFDMQPLAPPAVVVRNEHPKLAVDPAIAIPPQVKLASNNMPNLGDPLSHIPSGPPSNGTGSGSGIGSGSGGGVGSGEGVGFGPGHGGGTGGGVFRVGGGVSAPRALYSPDPEYSEEARKAKYQGVCVLNLVVGPDGKPRDIKVTHTLGLGLDEKAIEAVQKWKFDPALKDGKPVAVLISVEVSFRLY